MSIGASPPGSPFLFNPSIKQKQPLNPISTSKDVVSSTSSSSSSSGTQLSPASSLFASFGLAAQALQMNQRQKSPDVGQGSLLSFHEDLDCFKSASAPDRTNAFPVQDDEVENSLHALDPPLHSSPAQAFLSMFSPVAASPRTEAENRDQKVAGYTLREILGHGGFSTVRKGVSSSGDVVAIKCIRRSELDAQDDPEECRKQLDNEFEIWKDLNHEHILPLFACERDLDAYYFVTLYCPTGSLFDILKRDGHPALAQDDVGTLFRQVVRGIRYLHEQARVVHGDIKMENVLVDEAGVCRISDFGLSRRITDSDLASPEDICLCHRGPSSNLSTGVVNSSALHSEPHNGVERLRRYTTISSAAGRRSRRTSRHRNYTSFGMEQPPPSLQANQQFHPGSLPYASPELLSPPSLVHASNCGLHVKQLPPANPAQDMWALGVLLYALLTGRLPFQDAFQPRLQMKILHGVYDPPQFVGSGAESVLRGCLEKNVDERWTAQMVDDVAWSVGWGSASDEIASPTSPVDVGVEEGRGSRSRSRSAARMGSVPYPSPTRSRSRVRPGQHAHGRAFLDHSPPRGISSNPSQRYPSVFSSSRSRSRVSQPIRQISIDEDEELLSDRWQTVSSATRPLLISDVDEELGPSLSDEFYSLSTSRSPPLSLIRSGLRPPTLSTSSGSDSGSSARSDSNSSRQSQDCGSDKDMLNTLVSPTPRAHSQAHSATQSRGLSKVETQLHALSLSLSRSRSGHTSPVTPSDMVTSGSLPLHVDAIDVEGVESVDGDAVVRAEERAMPVGRGGINVNVERTMEEAAMATRGRRRVVMRKE